jgi:hypothetical protein
MWSWNQFRNLPKNQGLSPQEQARQYFIHQSNMMMEASNNNAAAAASSAAGAGAGAGGAGGGRKKVSDFPAVSGQSYIITWLDDTDDLWKFLVYNFGTGQLSDTYTTDLGTDWSLDDDEKAVQSKGFSLLFQNNNDSTYRIYFVNVEGTLVGEKSLDTNEDFQYTENAIGYLGLLSGVSTLYHFDGYNVRTHTFDVSIGSVEIDDGNNDDVTADGSIIVEAPNNQKYYIARTNGDLVEVSEYLTGLSSFRLDYNTNFIYSTFTSSTIKVVSQEGSLLNTFDVTPFNMTGLNESNLYGENCAVSDFDNVDTTLVVSYDGDTNQFVSLTFSTLSYNIDSTSRNWSNNLCSFGKNLLVSNYNEITNNNLGPVVTDLNIWWLPKAATEFNHVNLSSLGTASLILGNGDLSNISFSLGENPIFMYAQEATSSEIIVGFLEESGFSTQSTGILAASCSNIWGHNIGEHSFAVFDVGSDRVWQMYDNNSKVAETQTTSGWSWGDNSTRYSLRNGTLAVIDSEDTSNSFIYTTEIGLTAGPTGLGRVYNIDAYGSNTGISYEYQVITQFIPGQELNQYVDGFYVLSKSGLSEYVEFFVGGLSPSATYSINEVDTQYCIGSEMISFRLQNSNTGNHRYQVYNRSTLELIDDYETDNDATNYYPYDNRFYMEDDDESGNVQIRLVSLSGVEVLNLNTTNFNREANDAVDNG